MKRETKRKGSLRFIIPPVVSAAVTLLAFFMMQGIPMLRTLQRRTDLVSAVVRQDGRMVTLTESGEIVRAAEVAGVLARRFGATVEGEPDTCYEFCFADGSRLTVGVLENNIFYNGKWYRGAATTPELFRKLTRGRFFGQTKEL